MRLFALDFSLLLVFILLISRNKDFFFCILYKGSDTNWKISHNFKMSAKYISFQFRSEMTPAARVPRKKNQMSATIKRSLCCSRCSTAVREGEREWVLVPIAKEMGYDEVIIQCVSVRIRQESEWEMNGTTNCRVEYTIHAHFVLFSEIAMVIMR